MIKKILLIITLSCISVNLVKADDFPKLSGRVVDEADILSSEQKQQLTQILQQAEPKQVVAVSLKSLRGQEIEEYGVALGRHWQIGTKGRDDGVLVIIAPNDRQMRIEVGYGLEGELTDAKSSKIIRNIMLPLAKEGNYAESLISGSEAVVKIVSGENINFDTFQENNDDISATGVFMCFIPVILCFLYSAVFDILHGSDYKTNSQTNKKLFWLENVLTPSFLANTFVFTLTMPVFNSVILYVLILIPVLLFINIDNFIRWKKNPDFPYLRQSGSGSSGGRSSGGRRSSGGGGFSGHGGSFGGGGASGRW